MNDRMRELQKLMDAEKRKILHCTHQWGNAFYNPETVREGYGSKMEAHGSDVYYDYEGYHDVQKPRWTRKCSKCGCEDHTNKQKPVIKEYKPDFGG